MTTTNFIDGTTIVVADWLNDVDAHAYNQQTAAHSAANIAFTPAGTIAATDVQAAIAEVASEAATAITNLTATQVAYTPTGSVAATNVQMAIDEVVAETVQKTGDTGSAKMPSGTTAQRDGSPSAGWTRFNSTLGCNETYNGTEWVPDRPIVSAVQSTASGTAVDLSSIPAWVRELEVVLLGVGLSGTDNLLVQLGTAGGVVSTGYVAASGHTSGGATAAVDSTAGFISYVALASRVTTGRMTLTRAGTTWIATHVVRVEANTVSYGAGSVVIADPVTTLRLTRTGTNTFDAGSFYVIMKGLV